MVIFVDYSCHDGFSADSSQVGYVADGLRFDVRGPLLPGLVRPVTAVGADAIIALRCREASSQREAICNTPHTQTQPA